MPTAGLQRAAGGYLGVLPGLVAPRELEGGQVGAGQLRVVVEHLLKVGHVPAVGAGGGQWGPGGPGGVGEMGGARWGGWGKLSWRAGTTSNSVVWPGCGAAGVCSRQAVPSHRHTGANTNISSTFGWIYPSPPKHIYTAPPPPCPHTPIALIPQPAHHHSSTE